MNLTKRCKVTAFITSVIMLAAIVVAAYIFTIPKLYKSEDINLSTTATMYGSEAASYSASNTFTTYSALSEGDLRILFPQKIYIDKNENLEDTGYYIAYDAWGSVTSWGQTKTSRIYVFDHVCGYYSQADSNCYNPTSASESQPNILTMQNTFDNYGFEKRESLGATDGSNPRVAEGIAGYNNVRNTGLILEAKKVNTVAKSYLKGEIKSTYKNRDIINNGSPDLIFTPQTGIIYAALSYGGTAGTDSGWSNTGSYIFNSYRSDSQDFHLISEVAGAPHRFNENGTDVKVDIIIYDKSVLNTTINNFKTKIESNKTLSTYSQAKTFIDNIEDKVLKKREVTQDAINAATSDINRYLGIYEAANSFIATINENKTLLNSLNGGDETFNAANNLIVNDIIPNYLTYNSGWTINDTQAQTAKNKINNYTFKFNKPSSLATDSKVYDGETYSLTSALWSRYNGSYYDVKYYSGSGSSLAESEIRNAGNYTIKIAPKSTATIGGKKLQWSDETTGFESCAAYEVTPKAITCSSPPASLPDLTYNNADQQLSFPSGVSVDILKPTDNAMKVYWSLVNIAATSSDWKESISVKNAGTYNVYYKITAPNHSAYLNSLQVTMNPRTMGAPSPSPSARYTFDNTDKTVEWPSDSVADILGDNEMSVLWSFDNLAEGSADWKSSVTVKDARDYTVYYKITAPNHTAYLGNMTVTVDPRAMSVELGKTKVELGFTNALQTVGFGDVDPSVDTAGVEYTVKMTLGAKPASDSEWDALGESVSVKNVGAYTVNYRVSAPNHVSKTGTFSISVSKAKITIIIDKYTQTYGDTLLTSSQILENMVHPDTGNILNAENFAGTKSLLSDMIEEFVIGSVSNPVTGTPDKGEYDIAVKRNESSQLHANIESITLKYAAGAYVIEPKEITVDWTDKNRYYSGSGSNRPDAAAVSGVLTGTSAQLSIVKLKGAGVAADGVTPVQLVNGSAVKAGKYTAYVTLGNDNYTLKNPEYEFEIKPRPITITLKDYTIGYGSATAAQMWNYYLSTELVSNTNDDIYTVSTTLNDGKSAIISGENVADVFTVAISAATDSITYLAARRYNLTISLLSSDYVLTDSSAGAEFIVAKANIDIVGVNQKTLDMIFNGREQNAEIDKSGVALKGAEKNDESALTVLYSADGVNYSEDIIAIRNAGDTKIYFKVTAANHNDNTGWFDVHMHRAYISVTVANKYTATYGDTPLTSDELISHMGITWQATQGSTITEGTYRDIISYMVIANSVEISGVRTNVGDYTVTHKFSDESERANFVFSYTMRGDEQSNLNAYSIAPKAIHVDWKQSGTGWLDDGLSYTYSNAIPPDVTPIPLADDVVEGDVFQLLSWRYTGSKVGHYTAHTDLTSDRNIKNYTLINDTQEFEIVPLEISVVIKAQEATYGSAGDLLLNKPLTAPGYASSTWGYVDGSAQFFGEDYTSFILAPVDWSTSNGHNLDAGVYTIEMRPDWHADTTITDNYRVKIVTTAELSDKLTIKQAEIHFSSVQFNIDFENKDEKNYIVKKQIKDGVSTPIDVDYEEFAVEMSDLFYRDDDVAIDGVSWVDSTSEITQESDCGKYYVWVRIKHFNSEYSVSNFKDYTMKVEVNILCDWVSATIGKGVTNAEYGDDVLSSDELFERIVFSGIYGFINEETGRQLWEDDSAAAIALLKTYVSLYVGTGNGLEKMDKNRDFGTYPIFLESLSDTDGKYENFRFLGNTNIGAYTVGKRTVKINWGNLNEIYGEHSDSSNSHIGYTLSNQLPGDVVTVTFKYEVAEGSTGSIVGGHVRNAGEYKLIATGVSHPNYQLDPDNLFATFTIAPREIEVTIQNRSIEYGSDADHKANVNAFLDMVGAGVKKYDITKGNVLATDSDSDIFDLEIGEYELASNLNYLPVGAYDIVGKLIGNTNYSVTFVQAKLTVTNATMTYQRNQFAPKVYNGSDQLIFTKAEFNALKYYTPKGDVDAVRETLNVFFKFSGENDSLYASERTIKDVGTYNIDIKIEVANHEPYYATSLEIVVNQINVEISMSNTHKYYGESESELLTQENVATFSQWLWKKCSISIRAFDDKGNDVQVSGLKEAFDFKVVFYDSSTTGFVAVGGNPVGSYNVVYVSTANIVKNYSVSYKDNCYLGAYIIDKRQVEVVWTFDGSDRVAGENKFYYSGIAPNYGAAPAAKVIASFSHYYEKDGAIVSESKTLALAPLDDPKYNVGSYTARIGANSDKDFIGNYAFTNTSIEFGIVARPVTITIKDMAANYGELTISDVIDTHNQFTADYANFPTQLLSLSIDYTPQANVNYVPADEYRILGEVSGNNFDPTFVGENGNADAKFIVNPAQMSINQKNYTLPYQSSALELDLWQYIDTNNLYTLKGDMKWSDASVLYLQSDGSYSAQKPVIAGVQTIGINIKVQVGNHVDRTAIFSVTIEPAKLIINFSEGASSIYGEEFLDSDGIFESANVTLDPTSDISVDLKSIITLGVDFDPIVSSRKHAVKYEFINPDDVNYYNITLVGAGNAYEIKKREVVVSWDYAAAFEYDKTQKSVSAEFNGVLDGDVADFSATYSDISKTSAGRYTAKVLQIVDKSGNGYCELYYKLGGALTLEWEILSKSIEVAWTAPDLTYNGAPQNVGVPTILTSLCAGDNCDISISDSYVDAGTHTAVATASNKNYKVSNNTFDFIIKKAELDIDWIVGEITYNGKEQAPSAQIVSGLVNGDECEIIIGGGAINAGTHTANASAGNGNYEINSQKTSKEYTIAKKAVTFTWVNVDLTYTNEAQAPTAVANEDDVVSGDVVEFVVEGAKIDVGSGYIASVVGVDNPNYVVDGVRQTVVSTNFTIGKGVNEFTSELTLPAAVTKMPWTGNDKPSAKWGDVEIKYYYDEECTQEVADIATAGEGTYWIKAFVAGTSNYEDLVSDPIMIQLQGGINLALVIIGVVLSVALLAGSFAVVKTTNKKKQK